MPAIIQRSVLLVASLAALGACTRAEPPAASVSATASPPPAPVPVVTTAAEAIAYLRSAETFDDVRVGYSGSLSEGVAAFRLVLASPGARAAFHELLDHGTPAGRLYGVVGLYFADRAAFGPAVAELAKAGGDVTRRQGCGEDRDRVANVLLSPGQPRVVVAPGDTFETALARAPRGASCDIEGGCIPLEFAATK